MAKRQTTFLLKRSNVPGKIPPISGLTSGELALNTADAILYTSGSTSGTILPIGWDRVAITGDTMTGTLFTPYLSATTVSATTYFNLPTDVRVTGGTFNDTTGVATFTNNTGGTFNVNGFSIGGGGSVFTGGTITGPTVFTNGLTANTISATTYYNLPESTDTFVTGATYSNNTFTYTNNTGGTFNVLFNTVTGLTSSGTISTSVLSATTYFNLPTDVFVTGGTYTSGNAIFTNNTGGTFTVSGFNVGGGGGQVFYLNLSQSQNGNRLLSTTASTASEQTSGVTIANGVTSTIASFQSQPLNITLLPGGIWSFYLHSYKEDSNATFNIFVEVYKRTSGGTETLLFATDPAPVTTNSPNPSMQLSDGYFSGTSLNVSDSVVAVVRATNTDNQSHTITLVTEGSTHYSYVVSTIPTQQGLTCDTLSGCSIIQTIQTDISNKFDKSGGTVNGATNFTNGLSATTISATTYLNLPTTFMPAFESQEIFRGVTFSNNSTTVTSSGGVTMSTTASNLAISVSSTDFATKQIRLRYYSTTVSGGRYTGTRGSALLWYIHGGFRYVCDFRISDTGYSSTAQQFYGLAGSTVDLAYGGVGLTQVSTLTNLIGVGNDGTDTNLQIIHNDSTGTSTKIDLGSGFPANRTAGAATTTMYSLTLYNAPTSTEVLYRVVNNETGDVAEGTISTNLPSTTQGLNFFASRAMGGGGGVTGSGQFELSKLGVYSLL